MSETAANLPRLTYTPSIFSPPTFSSPSLPPVRPEAWIGAASPLWAYFTGAAMLGVSWWWMTRWMQAPVRSEARISARQLAELARTEATTPVVAALVAEAPAETPIAGEAAPMAAPAEPQKPSRKSRGETEPRPH